MILPALPGPLERKTPIVRVEHHINSYRDVAEAWAAKGYPVLPVRRQPIKSPYTRAGTMPTTDRNQIWDWWDKWCCANTGVVLDASGVMVLDVDGPSGEESLARLLQDAGVGLPDTYTVSTGRPDGGRHLWFRLAENCPALTSQSSHPDGPHPGLDVKFNGYVVGTGSVHETGVRYTANWIGVPDKHDLPELPVEVYQVLTRYSRLWVPAPPKKRKPRQDTSAPTAETVRGPEKAGSPFRSRRPSRVAPVHGDSGAALQVLPEWARTRLTGLLNDESDGRNARCYRAVLLLVREDVSDDDIKNILLSSPLGAKAHESGNPDRYIQQKINSARQGSPVQVQHDWDPVAYFWAAQSIALGNSETRVLHSLLAAGWHKGVIRKGVAMIAIDSAISTGGASPLIHKLINKGLVRIVDRGSPEDGIPRMYGLVMPERQNLNRVLGPHYLESSTPSPSLPFPSQPRSFCFQVLSLLARHDAFRSKKGSLSAAYPLLVRLTDGPQSAHDLAEQLGRHVRTVERQVAELVDAGLALKEGNAYRAAPGDPIPALDRVAQRVGTAGMRNQAIKECRQDCLNWKKKKADWTKDVQIPGTKEWRAKKSMVIRARYADSGYESLLQDWRSTGKTDEDLVEYLVGQQLAYATGTHRLHGPRWFRGRLVPGLAPDAPEASSILPIHQSGPRDSAGTTAARPIGARRG